MGIPSCRFMDKLHEEFICSVCLDVTLDPVLDDECQHVFCRECIKKDTLDKCPTCQEPFEVVIELPLCFRRCYLALRVRCLNPSCDQALDVTTFLDHDKRCPITFESCSNCGDKSKRGSSSVHPCEKIQMEKRVSDAVNKRMESVAKERKETCCCSNGDSSNRDWTNHSWSNRAENRVRCVIGRYTNWSLDQGRI